MKTLDEIKNEVAVHNGYSTWAYFNEVAFRIEVDAAVNVVARRYAEQQKKDWYGRLLNKLTSISKGHISLNNYIAEVKSKL